MPTYDFICNACSRRFDVFQTYAEYGKTPVHCTHCNSGDVRRRMTKVRIAKSENSRMESMTDTSLRTDAYSMPTLDRFVGLEVGVSGWITIDQHRIDAFADCTGDRQWIHVDVERARRESPYATTIAHGYLTLSLCVPLMSRTLNLEGYRMGINYGVNRVRFPAPLPSGSRIRGRFTVQSVDEVEGGEQGVVLATIEREDGDKPVCVAEVVLRMIR